MSYLVSVGFIVAGAVAVLCGIYTLSRPAGHIALGCFLCAAGAWPHWIRR